MIPKKIHYCWFGGKPLPNSVKKCIKSWKKFCPDYEIIEWNESNYDVNKIPFIQQAYQAKKYAFVSDYVRLDIIYFEGGIYLDTDVELLKNLDPLLVNQCFLAMELPGLVNTGLGFGAQKGHWFIKENMDFYRKIDFDTNNIITCVKITTDLLKKYDFSFDNSKQVVKDISIFPTEYFCPMNYQTKELKITDNTYSIHHYDATWQPMSMKFKSFLKKVLGDKQIMFLKKIKNIF